MTTRCDDQPTGDASTTEDVFLDGRLRLRQPRDSYRAGLDAVVLAAAVPIAGITSTTVLDAGSGVGTVGLCVAARCPSADVTLIEIDEGLAALAVANIAANALSDRARVVPGDLTDAAGLAARGLAANAFDYVVCNPPYLAQGQHRTPAHPVTARAFEMPDGGLDRWARAWAHLGRAGASLTLIHRADALKDILDALDGRFGDVAVTPLHPSAEAPARRIIVRAKKGSRAPLRLMPPIVVHDGPDRFTPRIEAVVRHGAALNLG